MPSVVTPEKKSSGTGERRQTGSAAARKREAQVKEQKEKLIKICIIVGIILFVIILAAALPKRNREEEPVSEESAVSEVVDVPTTERPFSDIRHLSFGPLSVDASGRTLTVAEFVQILNELYADGYVLIDPECITPAFGKNTVSVPEGKKPLIISQRDVSYSFLRQGSSYAQRLVLDSQGNVTCQYADRSGNVTYGDYDLIPALEIFHRYYGHRERNSIYDFFSKSEANDSPNNPASAPTDLKSRYITEDLPYALVPLAAVGKVLGVETPVIDSLITLGSVANEEDYRTTGRTLESLGLAGLSGDEILERFTKGF